MKPPTGPLLLRVVAGLLVLAGLLVWGGLAWTAVTQLDELSSKGEQGRDLMARALLGTVLMILGMIVLHFAADATERIEQRDRGRSSRA